MALNPLGHDLDLDKDEDVDWLVAWAKEAEQVVKELGEKLDAIGDLARKVVSRQRPLLPMLELHQDGAMLANYIEYLEDKIKKLEAELGVRTK